MRRIWLLDSGHGGIDPQGNYVTAPKKMYEHPDGTVIYEGKFNREIRDELLNLIIDDGSMEWFIINHGYKDMSLGERVRYANKLQKIHGRCVYVSIHGNAGRGKGFEVYTSIGETESDLIADVWIDEMSKIFPGQVDRGEKDRDFYVIKNTNCPAILTESFFMDTLKDCKLMLSEIGQNKVALAHYNMMKRVDKGEHYGQLT